MKFKELCDIGWAEYEFYMYSELENIYIVFYSSGVPIGTIVKNNMLVGTTYRILRGEDNQPILNKYIEQINSFIKSPDVNKGLNLLYIFFNV